MYSRKVWVQFEIPVLTVGKFVLLIILRDSSYMSYYYMSGLLAHRLIGPQQASTNGAMVLVA